MAVRLSKRRSRIEEREWPSPPRNKLRSIRLFEARVPSVFKTRKQAAAQQAAASEPAAAAGEPITPARSRTTTANPSRSGGRYHAAATQRRGS